jgi:hypothetical protein
MVDTQSATVWLALVSRTEIQHLLSLFLDPLRTVLAVKGSQGRAVRRALDDSGPF